MGLLDRLLGRNKDDNGLTPLWHRVVEIAREPQWYARGGIADTVPGRFDCITMVLSLVLVRMEQEESLRHRTARLTERFVADMDGQLRQNGIGDLVVGKHMGKLVSALGGRLDAYRAALTQPDDAALVEAVERNVSLTGGGDGRAVAGEMRLLAAALVATPEAELLAGNITR
ncbi:ubiquinol-cytochrome C chaperone family protein [Novosphingobium sp.]|uniref:ubiquinol-cytochrome C chaperone family protein n=1 Tax=Novosphingobium sp. TaxID=1874826 RepID=UPI003704177E